MFPKERKLLLSQTYKWEDKNRETGQLVQSNQPELEVRTPHGHPRVSTRLAVGFLAGGIQGGPSSTGHN